MLYFFLTKDWQEALSDFQISSLVKAWILPNKWSAESCNFYEWIQNVIDPRYKKAAGRSSVFLRGFLQVRLKPLQVWEFL